MVKENMKIVENSVKGITTLIDESDISKASVQGAWRFYNNDNVNIQELFEMIRLESRNIIKEISSSFILVAHDWSWLDFKNHNAKEDLIVRDKKGNGKQIGYDLHTSLLIDPLNGNPLSPLVINLQTAQEIYSSYDTELDISLTHLKELSKRCQYINTEVKEIDRNKDVVHIIDREADSVLFMRELQRENALFLIRVKDNTKVYWNKEQCNIKQKDLASKLSYGIEVGKIKYRKKQAKLFVNECDITITRDYAKMITLESGRKKLIKESGEPILGRFIVTRVIDGKGKVLATWMLASNIDKQRVDAKTIATWYYYRWNIESYFKLLKTTGFNLERWQQEKPIALFKRLIVVAYAIVLVFKLANSDDERAQEIRKFLVKLSGKLMEYGVEYTLPALLTGLWVFLRIMDLLENFSIDELYELRDHAQRIMGFDLFKV